MSVPDVDAAIDSLVLLQDRLSQLLDDPPPPERCRALLERLTRLGDIGDWCRMSGVALGRRTCPPLTYNEMQNITGVADATLHDRYRNWEREENE